MSSGALPVLATVIDWAALVVPIGWAANVSDVGVNVTAGAEAGGAAPVPDIGTLCGLFDALSVNASVAVRVPAALGRKATVTVQLLPAATVTPEQASAVFT